MNQKLLFIATMLVSIFCTGQIKVYTPSTSTKTKTDNSYKWVVKTDLLSYVSGEFPVAFEYRLGKKFSVEASAGITYAFLPNENLFDSKALSNKDSKAALGSAFRGSFKYYPSTDYDAIEGWFFGLQVYSKTTNRDYELSNNYNSSSLSVTGFEGKKDVKVKTGISLIIGKQIFQDSNVAFESYIGVGIANVSRTYYTTFYDFSINNGGKTYALPVNISETIPNFQLGFKLGFGN